MWEEAQKALNRDVLAAYIYLLVLTEETGRLFQKLGSKARSSCDSDRYKEIMYEVGKKIDKCQCRLSDKRDTETVGSPSLQKLGTAGIYPQTPHLTWKLVLPWPP